ncbi:MAG: hypothetical protein HRU29_11660 [Rhizobiales bacterium]|nr:hypothetical protein [Hyphomicrobiales bacterium]NRB15046.1 hypothetical protein [Hyphomicrobiales bacterium]
MIQWPDVLSGKSQSLLSKNSMTPVDTNIRTKMAAGADRVRRGTGVLRYEVNWGAILTQDEFDVFMFFYDVVLGHGSKFFEMDNIIHAKGNEKLKYRFIGPYNMPTRLDSKTYTVNAKFEVQSVSLITSNDLFLLEEWGINGVGDMAAAIDPIDLRPALDIYGAMI